MIDKEHLESILSRLAVVERELSDSAVTSNPKQFKALALEHASLKKLEAKAADYFRLIHAADEAREIIASSESDQAFRELVEAELSEAEDALPKAEKALASALLPPDPDWHRNAVLEIRAGTGGDEAGIFAGDLYRMYSRFAEIRGWKTMPIYASPSEMGGYKEIVFRIEGEGAYSMLHYEGGGHRVQRVPETESQGRIHTSAATVAVFPEADEHDELVIDPGDLRFDFYRAGGAGGQHVNKTDSAVRITHLPSGIVVASQEERSQHQNKDKCMNMLRTRLLNAAREKEEARMGSARRVMIGSGDRSERIRTYNFPQNRLTDHRINLTLYSLDRAMEGQIDELIEALIESNEALRLNASIDHAAGLKA